MSENRFLQGSSEQHHYETWINSPNFEAELAEVLKGNPNFDQSLQLQPQPQPVTQEQSNDDNSQRNTSLV